MKKYIFISAISIFMFFTSCSDIQSKEHEQEQEHFIFTVQERRKFNNYDYKIVIIEDRVKMKRYTILVCDMFRGGGCTLIDTECIKGD